MIKLKEIIQQLNDKSYHEIEGKLKKTKAENFLYVLHSYRKGNTEESEISEKLNLTANSLYVLKSRLYNRIQDELISDLNSNQKSVYSQLEQINDICYNSPRVLAIAFLHKLEKDLLAFAMNGELLIVYSALKKLHYNTDKYFHYSQLHNKHAAFWFSLEKTNDILSDFNLLIEQYDFSRSPELLKRIEFLKDEIANHYTLNRSQHTDIIKKIISIQLYLFCDIHPSDGIDTGDIIKDVLQLINKLPDSSDQKLWVAPIHYLAFEYYVKTGQHNKTLEFYNKTNDSLHNLLLFSSIAPVAKFLTSKIEYLASNKSGLDLKAEDTDELLYNNTNMYTVVQLGIYNSILLYHSKEIKKSISLLNSILSDFSLKDYFHIQMQIKFTLAFLYLKINEISMAESLVSSIYKKVKTEKLTQYSHALDLVKFFNTFFKTNASVGNNEKRAEALTLFLARNNSEHKILNFLQFELKNIT